MATYNGHNEDVSGNILLSIGNGMTATLETGTTASQAYTKGAYLYYNNRLCKVTSAIASGNTLTIGTNIAYTTLGEELTSHLKATNGDEFYFDYKNGEPGYYPSASKTASQFVPIGGTESSSIIALINNSWKTSTTAVSGSTSRQDFRMSIYFGDKTKMTYKCGTIYGRIMKRDGSVINASNLGTAGTDVDVSEYLSMLISSGQNTSFSFSLS